MPTKQPQDRKAKAQDGFAFTVAGRQFKLPLISERAAAKVPGGITMDAVLEPDDDTIQMRLGLAMLQAVEPTPAAMKALRSLDTEKMLTVISEWMGKSGGSSDSSESTGEPSSTTSEAATSTEG